ncbi:MAG: N-acetyltransferase [Bacilli bacterium]|nr:N-acetyltransferase [Bacilli bacterium]
MDINIIFDEANNQSLAYLDQTQVGECQFEIKEDRWYIVHTGVRPEYGGRGIAKLLVKRIIDEARKRRKKIVPICSYAQKMMLNNDEYKDVI